VSVQPSRPADPAAPNRLGPFGPPLLLLAVMWALELLDVALRGWLDSHGIEPRDADGLLGVLLAPVLHAGFSHLLANTVPLLVLGTLVATAGRGTFWRVTGTVVVLGGLGTWLIAPAGTITIGASGLVFGYLGYLLVAGLRTRHWIDLLVGALVLLLYGGLLLGALPWAVDGTISWQAHLTGAIAGGLAAWWWAPSRARSTTA
jgi:membrane associated rhomboid family serine protease